MPHGFAINAMPFVQHALHSSRLVGGPVAFRLINNTLTLAMASADVRLLLRYDVEALPDHEVPAALQVVIDAEAFASAIAAIAAAGYQTSLTLAVLVRYLHGDPVVHLTGESKEYLLPIVDADVPRVDRELMALLSAPRRAVTAQYPPESYRFLDVLVGPNSSQRLFEPVLGLDATVPPRADRHVRSGRQASLTAWQRCLGSTPGLYLDANVAAIIEPLSVPDEGAPGDIDDPDQP